MKYSTIPGFVDHVVRLGNVNLVEAILQEDAPQLGYGHGLKVLAFAVAAAKIGQTEILSSLIHSDAEVFENPKDFLHVSSNRHNPMFYAVCYGHTAAVKLLLTPSATYKGYDSATQTPHLLRMAAKKGFADICKLLLDTGSPGMRERLFQNTISDAARNGHLSVIKALLTYGDAKLTLSNICLDHAMLRAFWEDHLDIVRYLLQYGAQTHQPDEEKDKTLSRVELVKCLLQRGKLKLNDRRSCRLKRRWIMRSLLCLAAKIGDLHLAEFVLQHEDSDAATMEREFDWNHNWPTPRETALGAAQRLGHTEVANLLIAHGAIDHSNSSNPLPQPAQDPPKSPSPDSESDLDMQDASDFDFDTDTEE